MSLLRQIRRGFKASVLRSSPKITEDTVVSVAYHGRPENVGDESKISDVVVVSAVQEKPEDSPVSAAAPSSYGTVTSADSSQRASAYSQALIRIPKFNTKAANGFSRKENPFWSQTARFFCVLAVSLGALYIGKLAAIVITLCFLLVFKYLKRDLHIDNSRKSTRGRNLIHHVNRTYETACRAPDMMHPNCYKSVLLDKHLYNNSALSVKFPTKDVTLPKLTDSSEGLLVKKSSQDITHKKRAQLKRFNHTKPPAPSVSPCDDRVTDTCSDESSSLSWLKRTGSSNSGSSTAESSTTIGSPTDLRAQGEFKTRTILRPRWKLGKSRSVNSLSQDSEPGTMVGLQTPMDLNDSDESKSEVALRQKWKFGKSRSVHPSSQYPKPEIMGGFFSVKNVSDSSKSILNSSLLKKLKISSRASVSKDIRKENAAKLMYDPEKPTDSFCNETEQTERGSFPKPPKTKVESFSPDASNRNVNVSLNIPLPKMDRISQNEAAASTSLVVKEKSEKRVSAKAAVELRQRTEVPFHSLCKNTSAAPIQRSDELENYGVSSYNALLRPVAPKKSGELKQHIAVTTAMAWLTSGLAIVTGCLPMGRAIAVVVLVYYWHVVSICRKIRKASKKS